MKPSDAIDGLGALAQATRLEAFRRLMKAGPEGLPAGWLATALQVPHNTLSSHLSILAQAGLIQSRRESRSIIYSVNLKKVRGLLTFLLADCCNGHPEICSPLVELVDQPCCPPSKASRSI